MSRDGIAIDGSRLLHSLPGSESATAVYVISRGPSGPTKIGVSRRPMKRLASLQNASPEPLVLEAVFWLRDRGVAQEAETALHQSWADYRLCGEWFRVQPFQIVGQIGPTLEHWGFAEFMYL